MDDMQAKYYGLQKTAEQQMASLETSDTSRRQYARLNFLMYIETGEQKILSDNHENRLASLRQELAHLKTTDWQYEPIEKHIGQS